MRYTSAQMQQNRRRLVFLPMLLIPLFAATYVRASGRANDPVARTVCMAEILTPTEGVDFSSFVQTAWRKVSQRWFAYMPETAQLGRQGRVVVRFRINKDGTLPTGSLALEESSGRKDLDDAALSAIRSAAPFKKFPQEFAGPSIDLRFIFLYNLPLQSAKKP